MSEDFRNRYKSTNTSRTSYTNKSDKSSGDIFSLWQEQKRIEQEEQKQLALKRKKNQEIIDRKKANYKRQFNKFTAQSVVVLKKIWLEIKAFIMLLLDVLKSKPKVSVGLISAIALAFIGVVVLSSFTGNSTETATLGEVSEELRITEDLPREKPGFSILYPGGDESRYDIVRISPPEAAPSFTYLDKLSEDGVIFRVTQQEIPTDFDLKEVATEFQATDLIQVDGINVYSGFSEAARVQSIIFVKDAKLISIRSPQKISDENWVAYISSLE